MAPWCPCRHRRLRQEFFFCNRRLVNFNPQYDGCATSTLENVSTGDVPSIANNVAVPEFDVSHIGHDSVDGLTDELRKTDVDSRIHTQAGRNGSPSAVCLVAGHCTTDVPSAEDLFLDCSPDPVGCGTTCGSEQETLSSKEHVASQSTLSSKQRVLTKFTWLLVALLAMAVVCCCNVALRVSYGMSRRFDAIPRAVIQALKVPVTILPWSLVSPDHMPLSSFYALMTAWALVAGVMSGLAQSQNPDTVDFDRSAHETIVRNTGAEFAWNLQFIADVLIFVVEASCLALYWKAYHHRNTRALYVLGGLSSVFCLMILILHRIHVFNLYPYGPVIILLWWFRVLSDTGAGVQHDPGYLVFLGILYNVLPIGAGVVFLNYMMAIEETGKILIFTGYVIFQVAVIMITNITTQRCAQRGWSQTSAILVFPIAVGMDFFKQIKFLNLLKMDHVEEYNSFWLILFLEAVLVFLKDSGCLGNIILRTWSRILSSKERAQRLETQWFCAEVNMYSELVSILAVLFLIILEYIFDSTGIGTHAFTAYMAESQAKRLSLLWKFSLLATWFLFIGAAAHTYLHHRIRHDWSDSKDQQRLMVSMPSRQVGTCNALKLDLPLPEKHRPCESCFCSASAQTESCDSLNQRAEDTDGPDLMPLGSQHAVLPPMNVEALAMRFSWRLRMEHKVFLVLTAILMLVEPMFYTVRSAYHQKWGLS